MTNLTIDVRSDSDRVVVGLSGELDMAEIARLRQELDEIEAARPASIVLDLRGLTFIDSSGLRFVLETDRRARKDGRRVVIVPGEEPVHRVFLIALLDKRLDFVDPSEVDGQATEPPGTEGSA
jgi:anti-sigma B factor antagonist